MSALELVVGLLVLAGLLYWFRGYAGPLRRGYRRARDLVRLYRRARTGLQTARRPPAPRRGPPTVDASARPAPQIVCPTCGDRLSAAQVDALRARTVRCPGSSRVGRPCPYQARQTLN